MMHRVRLLPVAGLCAVLGLVGCAQPHEGPIDQSRIIAVRPSIPEGARQFVAQQHQPTNRPLFDRGPARKRDEPINTYRPAHEQSEPSLGQKIADFFNPAVWVRNRQEQRQEQALLQQEINRRAQQQQQGWGQPPQQDWQQPGGQAPPQLTFPQQPTAQPIPAPASQPDFGR